MFKFRSLTAKFIFMGCIVLTFFVAYITAVYIFTHHLTGEANRINLAGRERMQYVDFARHMLELPEELPVKERAELIAHVNQELSEYEDILVGLRDGGGKYGLPPIHSGARDAVSQNKRLIEVWQNVQRPELQGLMKNPDKVTARKFNLNMYSQVAELDRLVDLIEQHTNKERQYFDTFRYYAFAVFLIGAIANILYVRQSIIKPLWRLRNAARQMEKGNLEVLIDMPGKDDIGELSESFNQMSRGLKESFASNRKLIKNLNALRSASEAIGGELLIDKLLGMITDTARELIGSRYAAVGILNDKGGYEYFIPKGIEPKLLEEMMKRHGAPKGKGLLGHLLLESKPVRLDDISKHPASIGFPGGHPFMKAFLGVPIVLHGRATGRLYFADKHDNGNFTEEDEQLAMSFANTAALAIGNARLLNHVQVRSEELDILNKISKTASESLSLEIMLDRVLDSILNLEPLALEKKGAIFLSDNNTKVLDLVVSRNFSKEQEKMCAAPRYGECLCGRCAEDGVILFSENSAEDERHALSYPGMDAHSHIILPLKSRGGLLGILCLYLSSGAKLSGREIELYGSIADIISVSIQSAMNFKDLQKFASMLEATSDFVAIGRADGRVDYYNKAARKILEIGENEDISNIRFPDTHPGWALKRVMEEGLPAAVRDGTWSGETAFLSRGGREVPALQVIIAHKNAAGEVEFLSTIARDITDLKKAEESLKKYSEDLEINVRERTEELEIAKNIAVAANQAKSDFLANMSHELRTPLNAIIGFSEIMLNGMTGPLNDEQLDFTRDIDKSGKHLLTLINDILDLSKVEAGKMEFEPGTVNVQELIERSLMMFREKAMRRHINIHQRVEDGITDIIADEMKLKQVLVNLLSNAFKFTPDFGSVHVHARKVRSSERERIYSELDGNLDFAEISVTDTGPGIRAEDIPKLFQPFQQLDTTLTRKVPGTGLGLNLCKKFVEMHGGKIWVETEAGKGSTFLFVVPILQKTK